MGAVKIFARFSGAVGVGKPIGAMLQEGRLMFVVGSLRLSMDWSHSEESLTIC